MAPARPGGRPKNAWNSSRHRTLVRLYTLTWLTKEEIRKVLEAPDFNPSPSDIQKKLRALFPSDYAKNHRKYRPSNAGNMKSRLDQLRRCKRGRISKERRSRSQSTSRDSIQMEATESSRPTSIEGFAHAFRDYARLSAYDFPIVLSKDLANSEPVSSPLLLLDGSSLPASSHHYGSDVPRKYSVEGVFHKDIVSIMGSEVLKPSAIPDNKQLELSSKTATSIQGLGRRLANRYSDAHLKRIHSIIRYSSSNSWRSSLTSFSSRASSIFSKFPNHMPLDGDQVNNELQIWHELVDEGKLAPDPIPNYLGISPLKRGCCAALNQGVCGKCGFESIHRLAVSKTVIDEMSLLDPSLQPTDYYGNTALHCAASVCSEDELSKIGAMIWGVRQASKCNTFGETFLHILCRNGLRTLSGANNFLSILGDLTAIEGFPFSKRDFHGRTMLHILFQNSKGYKHSIELLRQIFRIVKPNLSIKDNTGSSVPSYLDFAGSSATYNKDLKSLIASFSAPSSAPLVFSDLMSRYSQPPRLKYFKVWLDDIIRNQFIESIDEAGDSPLIALLKGWDKECSEDKSLSQSVVRMIQAGSMIHMRDRSGDTALVVASRRGFRLVMNLLLENGAIVHSRNYRGVGILRQIEQALAIAKNAGNSILWSRIWTCQVALIDAGAMRNPTDEDEWKSPLFGRPLPEANSSGSLVYDESLANIF